MAGMITIESTGDFRKTDSFLKFLRDAKILNILEQYGQMGVDALASATPIDSAATANAWYYEVGKYGGAYKITWLNSNLNHGVPIAILLQYGHGTGTGGYVRGVDYINPAIKPVFDKISDQVWKAVTSA